MIRIFAFVCVFMMSVPQVSAQDRYPPIDDGRPGLIPAPYPVLPPPPPPPPPPLPFAANFSAEAQTGVITITTTGSATVTSTDPSVYLGDIGANYYHSCFASDSFYNTIGGSIDVIGSIAAGVWEYLGSATIFGSSSSVNISGDGYGVVSTGGFHFYSVSGVGQVTMEVEYDLSYESVNLPSNPGSHATAWIEMENMGGGGLQSDSETLNQNSSVNSQSGVLTLTYPVNGSQDIYLMAATEVRGYSVWDVGCP